MTIRSRPAIMRQVSTTSVHIGDGVINRRAESDTDSAICVVLDVGEAEKQLLPFSRATTPPVVTAWSPPNQSSKFQNKLGRSLLFLLPSFVSQRFQRMPMVTKTTHEIPALDGLRGLAALFVFNVHFSFDFDRSFLIGYGVNGKKTIVQWPIARIPWSGLSMIAILFAISGYVLSYQALRHVHSGNVADAHRRIASSAIRRGFRLYIPTFAAILMYGLLSFAGCFEWAWSVHTDTTYSWGLHERPPPRFENVLEQLWDISKHSVGLLNAWSSTDGNVHAGDYDLHSWAIPVEFRNSMLLFLTLLSISRLRTASRLTAQVVVLVFTILVQNRNMTLFLAGMLLADLDLVRKSRSRFVSFASNSPLRASFFLKMVSPHSIIYPIFFLLGLFICSVPVSGFDQDPIYKNLVTIIPATVKDRVEWFRVPGALMLVWSVANSAYLKPIFTNSVTTYLGKISFALYLVHGNIIKMILHALFPLIFRLTGSGVREDQTTSQMISAWFLAASVIVPLTIWVADLFWRCIDLPCVQLAKCVETQLCDTDDEHTPCTSPKRW